MAKGFGEEAADAGTEARVGTVEGWGHGRIMPANSRALTPSQKAQISDLFHAGLTKRQTAVCMGLGYDTIKTQWQAQGLIKGPPEPSEDVRIRAASARFLRDAGRVFANG